MLPTIEDLFSKNGMNDLIFVNHLETEERNLIENAFKEYGILIADLAAKEARKLAYPGTEWMVEVTVGLETKKQIK